MPDPKLPEGFLIAAEKLIGSAGKPAQGQLRRAISTCYYAVFHALAKLCADSLIGSTKASRPNNAWVEVYRGIGHGLCKDACFRAKTIPGFPPELHDFSDAFIQLLDARENADYNPLVRPTKQDALFFVSLARKSISALRGVRSVDKRAFAAWVLITSPGAMAARKRTGNRAMR
jgi:hypothetical protein